MSTWEELQFKQYLFTFLHKPYLWNGKNVLTGMDCSGGVQEWLRYFGINFPSARSSQMLHNELVNMPGQSKKGLGALAFYGINRDSVTHIAMMIDSKRVIEFGGGNQLTLNRNDAALKGACCRVRMLDYRPNLLSVFMLNQIEEILRGEEET